MRSVRSVLFTLPLICLATAVMATISIFASIFDRHGHTQHKLARAWSRMLLAIGFVRVGTEGLEKLDPARSYVLASNHTSYFDTPAILANIPLEFRFFAKQYLFNIPFLGWHLARAGHFLVVPDDPRASLKSMTEASRQMRDRHLSVLLFPEGGRSEHTLQDFKEGAAHLAIKAQVPIVPIGITGARNVLPMHSIHVQRGAIQLRVGDPIPTGTLTPKDRAALTRAVMERVAALVDEPVPAATQV